MVRRKPIRTRGKILFSQYFKNLNENDVVAVTKERAVRTGFPSNLQGRTGVIKGKRGNSYLVEINDKNKKKEHIIHPIHLKKLKTPSKEENKPAANNQTGK